ncbi:MAG: peptide chain release factor N(5)-glutamine methyltransferase [Candidatus Omnitrophota bacterium]
MTVGDTLPEQYRTRTSYFYQSELFVDERVLIPRAETELLVEVAVDIARRKGAGSQGVRLAALDLCTGSGNIAISLTKSVILDTIIACDVSNEALSVARINAARHGVSDKVRYVRSDLFERIEGVFDIITANPPYVASAELATLPEEVLAEPRIALDGGFDGLDVIRRILVSAPAFLRSGGYLVMEMGYDQSSKVATLVDMTERLHCVAIKKDYSGIDRVLVAKVNG